MLSAIIPVVLIATTAAAQERDTPQVAHREAASGKDREKDREKEKEKEKALSSENVRIDPALLAGLEYRSLGFSRGGRSTTAAGVPTDPLTYYFGSTGGGVWKTGNGGQTWTNVSDGQFEAGGIGALAVADSDPNVIYVGTGSACPRGNISAGIGMYKTTDGGKTWKHTGLRHAGQIGRIRVHPRDSNLVYVAALGNIFAPNEDRGVYRSKDGGGTWQKVHFVSARTGAVDIAMDITNPRILYAAMWTVERKPWSIDSGSKEGGLFKSTDGGDSWKKLEGGLPADVMVGKIGVTVSPANPDRVWALVEAADDKGGVYRSDDAGKTWQRTNTQRMLLQRAWYYMHIVADPKDANTVYALNVGFYKSTDGGRTFNPINVPHGDNHDLWINPNNPQTMVYADDGGAAVSTTGGAAWTSQQNQPTAEIYRVTVDSRYPYRVLRGAAGQQHRLTAEPGGGLLVPRRAHQLQHRRRVRERPYRRGSAQSECRVRGLLRGDPHESQYRHRHRRERAAVSGAPDRTSRARHEIPLPVELPDPDLAACARRGLHHLSGGPSIEGQRPQLGGHQSGPDAQ